MSNNARPKSKVIRHAKKNGQTVHLANLMDLFQLKNAELVKHLQKYKERVSSRCATSKTKKDTEHAQSVVLQRLGWRQSSWTPSQSCLVWLEKQATQSRRTQVKMTDAPRLLRTSKMNACMWQELDDQVIKIS